MKHQTDILITALAPAIWGSTYIITTEFLPAGYPVTASLLRALPAGLLLLFLVRELPQAGWWLKVFLLGALNFTIFWVLLFEAAYRLPGGVAAILGAVQPLMVIFLSKIFMNRQIYFLSILAAMLGLFGVVLLLLGPDAELDTIGIIAGLAGAASMALGTVLSRKWKPDVSLLTFTSWQLTAGGLLLLPLAFIMEPPLPSLTTENFGGFLYLGLIGAAATYILWFRGISKLPPAVVSTLGFLSPAVAILLGWLFLGQTFTLLQTSGVAFILFSIWLSQKSELRTPVPSTVKS